MIKVLDKHVADKIAAGEVIDRPVSIIKELLENAIDAGADNITVEIRNGGKTYIRVTDNGCGIEADDMETAFKRHATSKINSVKDLDSIRTLGFRGEALASICAVSRVELISKTAFAKIGRRIVVEGSTVLLNEGTGCPDGTTVTVRDLFYNVPARQKFMSSDRGESRRIIDMVSRIALAYDNIKISLINGDSRVFTTQGRGNILNSIVNIYGNDIGKDLLPVDGEEENIKIKGFVSIPSSSVASRAKEIFCVNGRVISSKLLEKALDEAYKEKLFHGRFPIAFLFLTLSPEKLDVNIHPTKKEVRFDDDFKIMDFVTKSVKTTLKVKESLPEIRVENMENYREIKMKVPHFSEERTSYNPCYDTKHCKNHEDVKATDDLLASERKLFDDSSVGAAVNSGGEQLDIKNILSTIRKKEDDKQKESMQIIPTPKQRPFDFTELEYLGSIFNTYIMACDENDFYLIDQHAAHERVFYEKLMKQYTDAEKTSQQLLVPLNFNVSSFASETEDEWIKTIRNMGYDIEYFGNKSYIVREIPAFMEISEAESFLNDIFREIDDRQDFTNHKAVDKIIMRSCKSAVKGGDRLGSEEISVLIKDLKNCVNPFSCPHGRPTFIRMTKYEIEKMFKRV